MAKPERRSPQCLNCGCERVEAFCPECGQENTDRALPLGMLLQDLADEFLKFDAKLLVTLRPLIVRPGFLTVEFFEGRRARYISPMRLYFIVSALYFLVFSFGAERQLNNTFNKVYSNVSIPKKAESEPSRSRFTSERVVERSRQFSAWYLTNIALVLILMLPIYALLTKLLFLGSGRLFVEHLVFNLHVQSFIFLVTLPTTLLDFFTWNFIATTMIFPVYAYKAMRVVFGQPRWLTLLKSIGLLILEFGAAAVVGIAIFLGFILWP